MILDQLAEGLFPDYPNLVARWQMSACERMALVGLLSTIRPQISIEIGTRDGGSARFRYILEKVDAGRGQVQLYIHQG